MLIGYVIAGIWLIPALVGGMVDMDAKPKYGVLVYFTYPFKTSLNPFNNYGVVDLYYYGIAIFLISILGIIFAKNKVKAGLYKPCNSLCTTPAVIPILSKLPMSQLFWMHRFTTIAYAFLYGQLLSGRISKSILQLFL